MPAPPRWMRLPALAARFTSRDREIRGEAAEEARRLIAGLSTRTLPQLDQVLRARSAWADEWVQLRPGDLKALAAGEDGPTVLQLAMCHPSGYVRAEAIRLSAVISDGNDLAFLLLRLNDWVEPVRRASAAAVRARLEAWPASALVSVLPLLDQAAAWGRIQDRDVATAIEGRIARDAAALRAGLIAWDPHVRRACLARAWRSPDFDRLALVRLAALDSDGAIRRFVERHLRDFDERAADDAATALVERGSGRARSWALSRLLARGMTAVTDDHLCASHDSVRAVAQRFLAGSGEDAAARYRRLVDETRGRRLSYAILGLGETGAHEDVTILDGLRAHPLGAVRAAALMALARIRAPDIIQRAIAALGR